MTTRGIRRTVAAAAVLAGVTTLAAATGAGLGSEEEQRRRGRRREPPVSLDAPNTPYDGKFTFVRLQYGMGESLGGFGGGGFRGGGLPPWAHDYPRAERNFMRILDEITGLTPFLGPTGGNILRLGDPELFKYPLAYMSEPGFWTMSEEEVLTLRHYVEKGGFLIFDDFRGGHWYNFEEQMLRLLPEGRLVELDVSSPIFHAFFEIETLDFVQFYGRGGRPTFHGVYEDNDPTKRLLLIANYNNDIGEYWEYSDTGFTPIELSNEAYKLGVNYIIYSMTH